MEKPMDVRESVAMLESLCRSGDAAKLHREMFSDQATICGEGAPDVTGGSAKVLEALTEMLKVTPELSITVHQERSVTEDVSVTWLQWSSPSPDGGEPLAFRSLTVWKKDGLHWKIAGDMYGMGQFGG